jgi:hypothetical protein
MKLGCHCEEPRNGDAAISKALWGLLRGFAARNDTRASSFPATVLFQISD